MVNNRNQVAEQITHIKNLIEAINKADREYNNKRSSIPTMGVKVEAAVIKPRRKSLFASSRKPTQKEIERQQQQQEKKVVQDRKEIAKLNAAYDLAKSKLMKYINENKLWKNSELLMPLIQKINDQDIKKIYVDKIEKETKLEAEREQEQLKQQEKDFLNEHNAMEFIGENISRWFEIINMEVSTKSSVFEWQTEISEYAESRREDYSNLNFVNKIMLETPINKPLLNICLYEILSALQMEMNLENTGSYPQLLKEHKLGNAVAVVMDISLKEELIYNYIQAALEICDKLELTALKKELKDFNKLFQEQRLFKNVSRRNSI